MQLLGGRFHDLDQFIRMFRAGVPALEAAERIISKAELHLRNVLFRPSILSDKARCVPVAVRDHDHCLT